MRGTYRNLPKLQFLPFRIWSCFFPNVAGVISKQLICSVTTVRTAMVTAFDRLHETSCIIGFIEGREHPEQFIFQEFFTIAEGFPVVQNKQKAFIRR